MTMAGGGFLFLACSHCSIFQAILTCLFIVVSLGLSSFPLSFACQKTVAHHVWDHSVERRADSFRIVPPTTAVQPPFTFLWSSPLHSSGSLQEWEIKGDQQPDANYLSSHLWSSKDLGHKLCKVINSYIKYHFNIQTAILYLQDSGKCLQQLPTYSSWVPCRTRLCLNFIKDRILLAKMSLYLHIGMLTISLTIIAKFISLK